MKKLLMLLGTTTVLFLACNVNWNDLAIPEQVKVDTRPDLYLPLTPNLFTGNERGKYSPEKLITDNLSPAKVKEMIGKSMTGITVATYKDPAGKPDETIPQTYLLRYPIMEMQLDLSQYMEQLNVDRHPTGYPVDSGYPPGVTLSPPISIVKDEKVELRDMANLVTTMNYTRFGIKIKGNYAGILQVDISNGDADGFSVKESKGTYDSGYTYFVSSYDPAKTWTPDKHGTLTLNISLLQSPQGGNISPEFVLDWTTATVHPSGSGLADSVPLDLSSLGDTLENIQFETVTAYLYASGLSGSNATVSLTSGGSPLVATDTPLKDAADVPKFADGGEYAGPLPPRSTASDINLTGTLNKSLVPEAGVKLDYVVSFTKIELTNTPGNSNIGKTISAVLLIKLPLEFKYTGEEFTDTGTTYSDSKTGASITNSDYVEFKMKDAGDYSTMLGDEDLLKPIKEELPDDVTLDLKNLSLILTGCDTTLLPGVSIAIKQRSDAPTGMLIDFRSYAPGEDIRLNFKVEDDKPFAPVIHILLRKGTGGSAVLALGNGGQFRFGLAVEVESKLDATIEL
jgi:hypothetical protein